MAQFSVILVFTHSLSFIYPAVHPSKLIMMYRLVFTALMFSIL